MNIFASYSTLAHRTINVTPWHPKNHNARSGIDLAEFRESIKDSLTTIFISIPEGESATCQIQTPLEYVSHASMALNKAAFEAKRALRVVQAAKGQGLLPPERDLLLLNRYKVFLMPGVSLVEDVGVWANLEPRRTLRPSGGDSDSAVSEVMIVALANVSEVTVKGGQGNILWRSGSSNS